MPSRLLLSSLEAWGVVGHSDRRSQRDRATTSSGIAKQRGGFRVREMERRVRRRPLAGYPAM